MRPQSKTIRIVGLALISLTVVVAAVCGMRFAWPTREASDAGTAPPTARSSPAERSIVAKPGNRAAVDLSGTWKLDLKASDSMDSLLQAYGRSYLERSLAARIEPVQVVVQTDGAIEIEVQVPMIRRRETLRTDGSPTTILDMQGKPVESVSQWSADGKSLVTHATTIQNGKPVQIRTTRSLGADSNTLDVVLEINEPDGPDARFRRVFRRLPDTKPATPSSGE